MQYCQVSENGKIGSPRALPTTHQNISNFDALGDEVFPSYGFYPFIPSAPPSYNVATQRIEQQLQLSENAVTQSWTIISLSPEEQQAQVISRLTEIGQKIQPYLDSQVAVKQYESIISAASWNNSNIELYRNEAEQAIVYRDRVWQAFNDMVTGVQSGTIQAPTADEWFASLTPLWPTI